MLKVPFMVALFRIGNKVKHSHFVQIMRNLWIHMRIYVLSYRTLFMDFFLLFCVHYVTWNWSTVRCVRMNIVRVPTVIATTEQTISNSIVMRYATSLQSKRVLHMQTDKHLSSAPMALFGLTRLLNCCSWYVNGSFTTDTTAPLLQYFNEIGKKTIHWDANTYTQYVGKHNLFIRCVQFFCHRMCGLFAFLGRAIVSNIPQPRIPW